MALRSRQLLLHRYSSRTLCYYHRRDDDERRCSSNILLERRLRTRPYYYNYAGSTSNTSSSTALIVRNEIHTCHPPPPPPPPTWILLHTTNNQVRWFSNKNKKQDMKDNNNQHPPPLSKEEHEELRAEGWLQQMKYAPNIITASRIICTPVISFFIINHQFEAAVIGCSISAFTDWLDGYIARKYNRGTVLGTYLDPAADKFMVTSLSLALAYENMIPGWTAFVWIGRDVGLILTTYLHVKGATKDDGRPLLDPSRTPLKVKPSNLSKVNTMLQFGTMTMALGQAAFMTGSPFETAISTLCWLSCGTTIASGLSYADGSSLKDSGNDKK